MADDQDAPRLNLGSVIGDKISESIQNMDLVNVLQKMVAVTPDDEESEEVRDKLKGVLEQFNHLSSDDKERLSAQIKEGLANKLRMKLQDPNSLNMANLEGAIRDAVMYKLYLVAAGIILLIFLFVFFGYKLFKSIKEKEQKREDKKKAKQMKKRK